jgi:hypothetical protein
MSGTVIVVWAVLEAATLTLAQTAIVCGEVDRIWASYGVRFLCRDGPPQASDDRDLTIRVTVSDDGPAGVTLDPRRRPLGFVLRVSGRLRRLVLVSESGVRTLVQRSVPSHAKSPTDFYPRTIGRVIAHEVGHLLLDSTAHTRTGLMRAEFGSDDVIENGTRHFTLDETQQLRLARWRAEGEALPAPVLP